MNENEVVTRANQAIEILAASIEEIAAGKKDVLDQLERFVRNENVTAAIGGVQEVINTDLCSLPKHDSPQRASTALRGGHRVATFTCSSTSGDS